MTSSRSHRLPQIVAVVIGFLLTLTLASATPVKFDIPAQPAPAALQAFIKQSGLQVVYNADDLRTVSANAVQGELEPLAALQQLLAGTGFAAREQGPSHFVIESTVQKPGSVEGNVQNESGRPVAGAQVSLSGTNQAVITDKRGRFTVEEVPAGPQSLTITAAGMQNTKVTDVNVKTGHRLTLSSITIPAANYGIQSWPITWLVGRDGRLITARGLSGDELEVAICKALGLQSSPRKHGQESAAGQHSCPKQQFRRGLDPLSAYSPPQRRFLKGYEG